MPIREMRDGPPMLLDDRSSPHGSPVMCFRPAARLALGRRVDRRVGQGLGATGAWNATYEQLQACVCGSARTG